MAYWGTVAAKQTNKQTNNIPYIKYFNISAISLNTDSCFTPSFGLKEKVQVMKITLMFV